MILLGDKYDVPMIYAEGLRQLRAWYAEDIVEWDKRDLKFFARETDHLAVAEITRTLDDLPFHSVVLYHCCRLPPSVLLLGDPTNGCPPLRADDIGRTFMFFEAMTMFWHTFAIGLPDTDLFRRVSQCAHCRLDTIRPVLKAFFEIMPIAYVHEFLDASMWYPLTQGVKPHLCETCISSFNARLLAVRQRYRSGLDVCFK